MTPPDCAEIRQIHTDREAPSTPPPMGCELLQKTIAEQAVTRALLEQIDRKLDALDKNQTLLVNEVQKALVRLETNR